MVALGAALAAVSVVRAQAPPDFSGTWSLIEPREERGKPVGSPDGPLAAGGQDGFHPSIVIRQSAGELRFEGRTYHQDPQVHVYRLDGIETRYDTPSGRVTATATWNAGKLVVSSRRTFGTPMGEMTVETKETFSLVNGTLHLQQDETTAVGTTRKLATYEKALS